MPDTALQIGETHRGSAARVRHASEIPAHPEHFFRHIA
jgi:hypothetical protein